MTCCPKVLNIANIHTDENCAFEQMLHLKVVRKELLQRTIQVFAKDLKSKTSYPKGSK